VVVTKENIELLTSRDPNRSAYIALVQYSDGEKRYIIAPNGLKVGDSIMSGKGAIPEVGNALYLADIPLGASIHAIELTPGRGAVLASMLLSNYHQVKLEESY